jgi:hypothetical protein
MRMYFGSIRFSDQIFENAFLAVDTPKAKKNYCFVVLKTKSFVILVL